MLENTELDWTERECRPRYEVFSCSNNTDGGKVFVIFQALVTHLANRSIKTTFYYGKI